MYNYSDSSAVDRDLHYLNSSKAVVDKLFVALSGDFSSLGKNYSESFKYEHMLFTKGVYNADPSGQYNISHRSPLNLV